MFRNKERDVQASIWTVKSEIVRGPASDYYSKLEAGLQAANFATTIRDLSRPYYDQDESKGGRIGIDPYVYFKMLIVGFFENIGSERGIANRCADSISIREFLGYELTESTPNHSSLSRIRYRLGSEVFEAAFEIILGVLSQNKLLRGKQVGIDTSVLHANASMRTLVNNHTGETYDEYVKRLAEESEIDPEDKQSVRDFDRKRSNKKMSNKDWHNPHDPDAKIGPTKQKEIKMIHKVEHTVDVDTGAIIHIKALPGDQADDKQMASHIEEAQQKINKARQKTTDTRTIEKLTADKGYYNLAELEQIQNKGIRTVVDDKIRNRNLGKLSSNQREVVKKARRSTRSKYGKKIKKSRGEFLERSFTHVLDNGGLRKLSIRGTENIHKRLVIASMCCNISLLMRKIFGAGTPKQAIACFSRLLNTFLLKTGLLIYNLSCECNKCMIGKTICVSMMRASCRLGNIYTIKRVGISTAS